MSKIGPRSNARGCKQCSRSSQAKVRAGGGRGRRSGWLRECPPAFGLRLYFAPPPTTAPAATSVVVCTDHAPTVLEGSGWWGVQRSELLGSDTNFAATPCVAPREPQARRIWALTPKTRGGQPRS